MKTVEEIPRNERPAIYAVLYPKLRTIALENGYALAIHGSVVSDVDLLAVPWVENAISPDELISKFWEAIGLSVWNVRTDSDLKPEIRPHNRHAYLINIMGNVRIDVSVMPPIPN